MSNSLSDTVSKTITEECSKIFPLQNVLVHKAKVLKKPKFDLTKLMELYQEDKSEALVTPAASTNLIAESDKWLTRRVSGDYRTDKWEQHKQVFNIDRN